LVSIDADVNKPAYPVKGMTALECSAHWKVDTLGKIDYLLSKGANINEPPALTGGMTALEATVRPLSSLYDDDETEEDYYGPKPQIIESFSLLLRSGAAVNRVDGSPSPLLHDIIMRNEPEVLKLALEKGADKHHMWEAVYHDRTPLQLAAELGQLKSVELLLQHRADPNALPGSNHGRTALLAAASSESPDINIITLLISNGADVNAPPASQSRATSTSHSC
jgi:ankyrin repeat protein